MTEKRQINSCFFNRTQASRAMEAHSAPIDRKVLEFILERKDVKELFKPSSSDNQGTK